MSDRNRTRSARSSDSGSSRRPANDFRRSGAGRHHSDDIKGERGAIDRARARLFAGMSVPEPAPFVPDEFQQSAISNVVEGADTLVVAPTGSGKTFIALEAIAAFLQQGLHAIYTTPLKALSNGKYTEMKQRFEPAHKVGLLTGDRKIETDADVVVATTEIYRNELYRSYERFSLVVLDEVHFLADPQRGPVWEESIILTPRDSTLLMLSASISNHEEIAAWISSVRGRECRIVIKKDRPVELRFGFIHPDLGVLPLEERIEDSPEGKPRTKIFPEVMQFYSRYGMAADGMSLKLNRDQDRRAVSGRGAGSDRGPGSNRGTGRGGHPAPGSRSSSGRHGGGRSGGRHK